METRKRASSLMGQRSTGNKRFRQDEDIQVHVPILVPAKDINTWREKYVYWCSTLQLLFDNILNDPINSWRFIFTMGYIPNSRECPECGEKMTLSQLESNFYWRCRRRGGNMKLTALHGTWFSKSKLKINDILLFTYLWTSGEVSTSAIMQLTGIAKQTMTDWANFCRAVCCAILFKERERGEHMIGGEGVIVEINEFKFSKQKYNRGHKVDTKTWILRGRERENKEKLFMVEVPDCTAKTLLGEIVERVKPASIIYTGQSEGYSTLKDLGFTHQTINHSKNYKDPNTGGHTNYIEQEWHKWAKKLGSCKILREWAVSEFLAVHIYFKRLQKNERPFLKFMSDMSKDIYKGICREEKCIYCKCL